MSNKLLLADDSITIRKVVGIIFANEDYSLSVVDNGNAALEKAREIIPDIILADVLMPGNTGYEVCAEIRRDPALRHIPLLLLTGAFEPFDEEKARQSGADDFISKPFESQQLIEKVKSLIALGKERKMAPAAPEPVKAAAPTPSTEQFTVPSPEATILGEMGGVFLQVEEVAEAPSLQADQLFEIEEAAREPSLQPDQLSVTEEVIEARPEDDLWDVFSLDEVAEVEAADSQAVLEEEPEEQFSEDEAEKEFTFAEEEETTSLDAGPETAVVPPLVTAKLFDHIGEETSITGEEPPVAKPDTGMNFEFTSGPEEQATFVSGLDEVPPVASLALPEFELQFAPEEEYVPVLPPVEPIAPPVSLAEPIPPAIPVTPAAPVAVSPVVQGEMALDEEQLASIITKVSRDIIEKIAWEVVPDLAETLIREEIRKLKEGLRG